MIDIALIDAIKINNSYRILFILVEYFSINKEDHITNESFIESSNITACNEILLSFYSKVNSYVNLILFLYKQNVWKKEWEYRNNDSQWKFHQFKINMTDKNEDIQVKILPSISNLWKKRFSYFSFDLFLFQILLIKSLSLWLYLI